MTRRLPAQKSVALTIIALANQVRALQKANQNLRDSRDMWRERAYDRKKIKALQQASYRLRISRDRWRERARVAERRVR